MTHHQIDLAQFFNVSVRRGHWLDAPYQGWLDVPYHSPGVSDCYGDQDAFDLADLPTGLQTLAGTAFDVRGIVQVAGRHLGHRTDGSGPKYPPSVERIAVTNRFTHLHFLHGAVFSAPGTRVTNTNMFADLRVLRGAVLPFKDDAVIGKYVIHLDDGSSHEKPIVYGHDVHNWLSQTNSPSEATGGGVAWTGQPGGSKDFPRRAVRLYKSTWTNPYPEMEIKSVDFVSSIEDSVPFLLAITGE